MDPISAYMHVYIYNIHKHTYIYTPILVQRFECALKNIMIYVTVYRLL
jgi:hypothetical protein